MQQIISTLSTEAGGKSKRTVHSVGVGISQQTVCTCIGGVCVRKVCIGGMCVVMVWFYDTYFPVAAVVLFCVVRDCVGCVLSLPLP